MTLLSKVRVCHGGVRLPWHTLSMVCAMFLMFVVAGPAPDSLVFDRQAVLGGEVWRLVTGHWVHSDGEHLMWNLLAFALIGCLIEIRLDRHRLYTGLAIGMSSVTLCIGLFMPELDYYCGLSGVLNTLLFILLFDQWLRDGDRVAGIILLGATGKIVYELSTRSAILTDTLWPSVPEAHMTGALAAAVWVLLTSKRYQRTSRSYT